MAIKLVGVPGEKLLEDEKDATTQDFVLFDNPVFFIKNVADYVPFMEDFRNLKSSGLTLGKVPAGLKLLFSQDYKWRLLRATGSKKPDSPLRIYVLEHDPVEARRRGREVPARRPTSPVRRRSTSVDSPDKLRLAAVDHLKDHEARFDFFVQVQTDPVAMPVEDPTVDWDVALPEGRHDPHPAPGVRHARAEDVRREPLVHPLALAPRAPAAGRDQPGPQGDLPGDLEAAPRAERRSP